MATHNFDLPRFVRVNPLVANPEVDDKDVPLRYIAVRFPVAASHAFSVIGDELCADYPSKCCST